MRLITKMAVSKMKRLKYALVIGGTGMLQQVCHWLTENHYFVSVINRSSQRFQQLKENSTNPENLHSILVDYHHTDELTKKIDQATATHGYPDLVVSWIHSSAPYALPAILRACSYQDHPWELIHVQGSSSYFVKETIPVSKNCHYKRVYLGFVIEQKSSRWLTHEEIASGVIQTIRDNTTETVVGTLKPWSLRP